MRIVLDTNVLVSGLLSPAGPPGRIVDLVTAGRLVVLFDDRILAEYREVLARPRLRIEPAEAAAFLDLIEHEGLLTPAPPLAVELPDPDDLPFLELAAAGAADTLVTGSERDYQPLRGEHDVQVMSPARFPGRYTELHPRRWTGSVSTGWRRRRDPAGPRRGSAGYPCRPALDDPSRCGRLDKRWITVRSGGTGRCAGGRPRRGAWAGAAG